MDGEINPRQGQKRALQLNSVSITSFWKELVSPNLTGTLHQRGHSQSCRTPQLVSILPADLPSSVNCMSKGVFSLATYKEGSNSVSVNLKKNLVCTISVFRL